MIPDLFFLGLTLVGFAAMAWLAQLIDQRDDSEAGR